MGLGIKRSNRFCTKKFQPAISGYHCAPMCIYRSHHTNAGSSAPFMQIIFHIGAHHTDEGLLLSSLRANAEALEAQRILVPDQAKYRTVLSDTLQKLRGNLASPELQDAVLDTILEEADGDRVIFSNENFSCMPSVIFNDGTLYDRLPKRISWLRNVFPDFDVTIAMGLRDPATLVPEAYSKLRDVAPFREWLDKIDLSSLSWHRVITDLRDALPDTPLLLWCNEDTPLLWPEIIQALTAHPESMTLEAQDTLLSTIMSKTGLQRMRAYLASSPPKTNEHRRRVVAAFLDKFAREEAMVDEIDLEGWTEEVMDPLSERYEADVDVIAAMPGVRFLLP
jgi:hypothetical protein